MTYWHMQMHQDDVNSADETSILEQGFIGLGDWANGASQINQFEHQMKIGDIVLIKRGAKPLALVEVVGDYTNSSLNSNEKIESDWIFHYRKIKVLEFASEKMISFPQPMKTLQKAVNKYTQTYSYIDNWYKRIINPNEIDLGLKIINVDIFKFKLFNNFEINFLDKEGNPLPIIVIAGRNGTGKTSLLEYIRELENGVSYQYDGRVKNDRSGIENIIYIDALTQNDKEVEQLILDYIDYFIYDESKDASVGAENLQNDIDEIFENFDLSFRFKKIDYKTKKPIFEPYNVVSDDIEIKLQELSTGERTLLSKVLSLYLQKPKGKVILVDEPETSLHPSWQNKILKFYENFAKINNNQIIIATHSPNIIASAKNEYLRILRKNEEGNVEVVNGLKAHGRDINSILFDVMGEVAYRPREFDEKIDRLHIAIDDRKMVEAEERLEELKKDYGENDEVVMEAQMLIDMFKRDDK